MLWWLSSIAESTTLSYQPLHLAYHREFFILIINIVHCFDANKRALHCIAY